MRTPHTTHTPHPPLAMDVMPPWQAFGAPPAPSTLDPRRWLGVALTMLTGAVARIARLRAATRGPASGAQS